MQLAEYRGTPTELLTQTVVVSLTRLCQKSSVSLHTQTRNKEMNRFDFPSHFILIKIDLFSVDIVYDQANVAILQWRYQCAIVYHFPCSLSLLGEPHFAYQCHQNIHALEIPFQQFQVFSFQNDEQLL